MKKFIISYKYDTTVAHNAISSRLTNYRWIEKLIAFGYKEKLHHAITNIDGYFVHRATDSESDTYTATGSKTTGCSAQDFAAEVDRVISTLVREAQADDHECNEIRMFVVDSLFDDVPMADIDPSQCIKIDQRFIPVLKQTITEHVALLDSKCHAVHVILEDKTYCFGIHIEVNQALGIGYYVDQIKTLVDKHARLVHLLEQHHQDITLSDLSIALSLPGAKDYALSAICDMLPNDINSWPEFSGISVNVKINDSVCHFESHQMVDIDEHVLFHAARYQSATMERTEHGMHVTINFTASKPTRKRITASPR